MVAGDKDVLEVEPRLAVGGDALPQLEACLATGSAAPLGAGTVSSMTQSSAISSLKAVGSCSRKASLNRRMTSAVFSDRAAAPSVKISSLVVIA